MPGRRRDHALPALVPVLLTGAVLWTWTVLAGAEDAPAPEPAADLARVLGAAPQGFATASGRRTFAFPDDHGPHPAFRNEWWYYTGNVATPGGRRFAFQLTFFRFALTPRAPRRASAWASNQIYMAHFTVTDIEAARFHAAERFSRGALDLAGARARPLRVWLGDWQLSGGGADVPAHLAAADAGYAIDLALAENASVVLNGDAGLSRKGAAPGNASYYYSIPRTRVSGTLTTPDGAWPVRGDAWFDREWGSSALEADQVGWDWFALQLSDGRNLMLYRLRRAGGGADPHSAGTLVEADGTVRPLSVADFVLEELDYWRSPRDGARYPSRWRVRVPGAGIDVEVVPVTPNQELNLAFRYWEGASRVSGTSASAPVGGHGHVELTGYAPGGVTAPR